MSNSLDPDQARHSVGPDLGPNCLQKISTDNTSRQRVKVSSVYSDQMISEGTCFSGKKPSSCQCFCPKNLCFCQRLLHIFKCTPDDFYRGVKHYEPKSDCSLRSSLIWDHIVCNIGYQSTSGHVKQTSFVVKDRKRVNSLPTTADNLCKQFGPRPGPTKCRPWSGSKLFDTLMVFLKEILESPFWKKSTNDKKAWKITQWAKSWYVWLKLGE